MPLTFGSLDKQKKGAFSGPARGPSVAPVYPSQPTYTPNPAVQIAGSYTPDYSSLIQADPGLVAFRNTSGLTLDQAAAQRRQVIQSLVMQYGGLPSDVQDPFGDIDQGTLELAQKNQYSDVANLQRNYQDSLTAMKRALAARGVLRSSELPYGQSQVDLARGQKEYDLAHSFSNAAQGVLNSYTSLESQQRQAEANAIAQAAQNVYGNPANRPADAVMADYVAGSQEQYGAPVYQGPDGQLYNQDGSPFTAPPAAPTTMMSLPAPSNYSSPIYQAANVVNPPANAITDAAASLRDVIPITDGAASIRAALRRESRPSNAYGNAYQRRRQALA